MAPPLKGEQQPIDQNENTLSVQQIDHRSNDSSSIDKGNFKFEFKLIGISCELHFD